MVDVHSEEVFVPLNNSTMFCVTTTNRRFLALAYTCVLHEWSLCLSMAEYMMHICFMSTPLHGSLVMSDDTCYSIHRVRPFLHESVAMTGLLGEQLIELLSYDARQSSQTLANQPNVSSYGLPPLVVGVMCRD